ncbi:MAG: VRR-NUC domain-containing protein [Aequoribacter sp.]|uniref:VRR-NUC domain-containing protein n=1 Tax=Aequoribacter sp. TaxID=2847771 RepID=UPI003C42447F
MTSLAAVGKGVPDLLIGAEGVTILVEVKGPKGKLTDDQKKWHSSWLGDKVYIVRSKEEMAKAMWDAIDRADFG